MKRLLWIPFLLFAFLTMASCGGYGESFTPDSPNSRTIRVAQLIQTTLDCDMLEVKPATPYDNGYDAMLERAQEEWAAI